SEAAGRISNNVIRNNSSYGMRLQDWPNAAGVTPGPWTVDGNILRSNGSGATDYDIWVEDTYTGTLISGNTITGSLAANEAGIYALNQAGDLILSANYIISSTRGVWTNINGTFDAQRVKLYGNTIVSGTNGVLIQYTAGGATVPQVIIGGSCANANQIYGNTDQDLRLTNYGANITATHNYWGAHTLRDIEDRIYHNWDAGGLGIVTYEPAIYVPRTIDLQVSPTSLPADGMSTATITVTVRDECNNRALRGTMIGITTSCGTVDYGFAEAEDTTQVTRTNAWTSRTAGSWSRASNGEVLEASNANRRLEWAFRGRAVSLIYAKDVGGGKAEVRIDGTLVKTIDMASTQRELRVEDVIANNLDPNVIHIIEVRPDGSGNIWVDAFRSGGVVVSGGRIVTTLTAPNSPCTAKIWATVYDGALITASSTDLYPIITSTATVVFQAADLYISKSASPASINSGQRVTYTITYGNNGVEAGTSVLVTDTLPLDFLYVSSSSVPNREPPTLIAGNPQKLVWNIGTLVAGATGTITVVAKPDQSVAWTVPVVRNNVAQISSSVPDPVAGNNSSGPVPVTVLAPASLAISAHPPAIRVSNGTITTTLRITATDGNGNPIHNIPINVTTTVGTFPASGGTALVVTTTNGVALAALASSTTVTTATVRAEVMPIGFGLPWASTQVRFIPGYPFEITSTVYPTTPIQLCGGEAVVTATIRDRWGNLVEDGTEVNFNVVQGERGDMYPRLTTTLNGIAVSTLRTKGYLFGARSLDVYILSRRETQEATHLQRVDLQEGPPHTIGLTASPSPLPVGGREAEIRALVKDCGGNPVKDGTVVTFTASSLGTIAPVTATTLNGLAYGVFQSGCTMGTAVITAASDSRVSTISLLLEPGPADLISVDAPSPSAISNCGGTATIVATAYDSCGNLVKDGTEVQFTPQYGYVTASPVRALTQNGKASTRVTAQNKTLETWPTAVEQIDVTSGSAFPGFTNLTIRPGAASKVEVMADPDSIPINGDVNLYDIVVVARVVDCSNTPVQNGTAVALRTDLGIFRESGMRLLPRLTVGGLVTGTLTSQSIAGSVTITATADSVTGTTQVRFLPGEPWLISVWGYPETIYADGQSTSLITAWVKDEFNNPVLGGVTVTLVVDFGYFQETGQVSYTTYTDGFGYVFARLVSATTPRTVLVRAIAYNSRQGYSYVFFITPPPRRYLYMPFVQRRFPS
ncbi:MAG: DUF11 domain-containing protein, partial [Chloroflexi bacterium]|nr:DUF11 domain-containing protein [Chloroflexota bacterium]